MNKPAPELMAIAATCPANWQVLSVNGSVYTMQCRICKVYVVNGGTPKCLLPKESKQAPFLIMNQIEITTDKLTPNLSEIELPKLLTKRSLSKIKM